MRAEVGFKVANIIEYDSNNNKYNNHVYSYITTQNDNYFNNPTIIIIVI